MTQAEIFELIQLAYSNSLASFAIFLTIVAAYLVAAFQAGAKLKFSELVIVNTLFVVMSCISIFTTAAFGLTAHNLTAEIAEINPSINRYDYPLLLMLFGIAEVAAVLACLWFMQGRRDRGEGNAST